MTQLYRAIVAMYPEKYRDLFAAEMQTTYNEAAANAKRKGAMAHVRFVVREWVGAALGLLQERLASWTGGDSYMAESLTEIETAEPSANVSELQRRLRLLIQGIEWAIAHHDFVKARLYCERERVIRRRLEMLLCDPFQELS